MPRVMLWVLGLLALGAATSCLAKESAPPPQESQPAPQLFVLVQDKPCSAMVASTRRILKQDPDLGLLKEEPVERGRGFLLPPKMEGDLNWQATVLVECLGTATTRISVRVKARRGQPGAWRPEPRTEPQEKAVLERLVP